ncbi:indolepyruvate ferredoxin oxidoreductase subunit alpha [Methanolapillus africanus]|uniref:indolepyruvate ferredoxin oxidoreductase subunit alpha n=1 Tax=Methanolapillus africanus TaxID=3028297 RepID=UPI0030B8775E
MTVTINRNKCGYCGACVAVCSTLALDLKEVRIEVDEELCNSCFICKKVCPVGAIEVKK